MENTLEKILEEAKKLVIPTQEEREKVYEVTNKILTTLRQIISEYGINAKPELEGSIAKDTWLPGDRDIDIFILFDKGFSKDELGSYGLKIAYDLASRLGAKCEERYAEHPYLKLYYEDFEIDVVPAYQVSSSEEIITAVDRTHLHTQYVLSKLKSNQELKVEIRLLKKFMKSIGVYGAEIKVGGFSGYLCELLILYYGSFIETLKAASQWRIGNTIIDLEGYYSPQDYKKLRKIFRAPLIVIDPVDKNRNAAAAVTNQRMAEFIVAARTFIRKPSIEFFKPPTEKPISKDEVIKELAKRETNLVALKLRVKRLPPDVLWGQIYRSLKNIVKFLEQFDFKVLDYGAWSNEKDTVILLFNVESLKLPQAQLHYGPPIGSSEEENFLKKYVGSNDAYAGPFIRGNRWYVIRKRKYTDIVSLIKEKYQVMGLVKELLRAAKEGFEIYLNEKVINATNEHDYHIFLRKWLFKKYFWLR